ncbi:hypothetical protein [Kribbella sp. NPDC050470]|uniref:hypothetical protein n=1 Tax=unclassified Kribbella TaxID=2644121 RepID=UPI0037BA0917
MLRYRPGSLIIGDTTVCLSGTAPGHNPQYNEARARHGIGVGVETCARINMPLTPELGLLLTRDGKPTRLVAERFIRTTIYNSREFVAHAPDWPRGRSRLETAFREDLHMSTLPCPASARSCGWAASRNLATEVDPFRLILELVALEKRASVFVLSRS